MSQTPFFSVIIPTCDRNALLKLCLERLAPGKQVPSTEFSYEVIVSDDSPNHSAQALVQAEFPWAKWTAGPRKGPAANRNHGASHAQGAWLVFTDDDCLPSSNWLHAFYLYTQTELYQALEGRILPSTQDFRDLWKCPINEHGNNFWSANIAIQASVFKALQGFDPNFPFPAYEDTDLYWRLKSKYKVQFVPEALIHHPLVYYTLSAALRKDCQVYHSRAYLLAKHSQAASVTQIIARECAIHARWLLYSIAKGFMRNALVHSFIIVCILPQLLWLIPRYKRILGSGVSIK